jgi:YVTN family beta-propeller protein
LEHEDLSNMSTLRTLSITTACLLTLLMPRAAAAAPFAYIANSNSDSVSVIDVATGAVVSTIPVGRGPYGVTANALGKSVYVLNSLDNSVSVIDTATRTVTATVAVGQLGGKPAGLALNRDATRLYVPNAQDGTLWVIDTATNAVAASIPVGVYPLGVAVSPSDAYVYVTNASSNSLSVISTATNTQVAAIPVGLNPIGVAAHPDGNLVYVATAEGLAVVDVSTMAVIGVVPVASAYGVAASADGARVYVTSHDGNALVVVDARTNTAVGAPIGVGAQAYGVSVTPDSRTVYVADSGSDSVSVVDTGMLTVINTIPVLAHPTALGAFITDAPPAATSARLTSSVNPSAYGQPITLTATVTTDAGDAASGNVEFFDGTASIGSATLNGGAAAMTVATPDAGTHAFTGVYHPAGAFAGSTSSTLTQTVAKATGTTSLTVSVLTPQYSDMETFKAFFTPTVAGGPAPAKVSFKVGTQPIGEATPVLTNSVYQYTWTGQLLDPAGSTTRQMKPDFRAISATFVDPNFDVTNPAPKAITIQKEDARVAYSGAAVLKLGLDGTVTLTATVRDITAVPGDLRWDNNPGDIRNAQVMFVDRSTGAIIATVTPTLSGSDSMTGTATYSWPVNLGSAKSKSYTIGFIVSYYYNRNSSADNVTILVTK